MSFSSLHKILCIRGPSKPISYGDLTTRRRIRAESNRQGSNNQRQPADSEASSTFNPCIIWVIRLGPGDHFLLAAGAAGAPSPGVVLSGRRGQPDFWDDSTRFASAIPKLSMRCSCRCCSRRAGSWPGALRTRGDSFHACEGERLAQTSGQRAGPGEVSGGSTHAVRVALRWGEWRTHHKEIARQVDADFAAPMPQPTVSEYNDDPGGSGSTRSPNGQRVRVAPSTGSPFKLPGVGGWHKVKLFEFAWIKQVCGPQSYALPSPKPNQS